MPYAAEISRANPSCFLFLIDQSGSMADPFGAGESRKRTADGVADAINHLLRELVLKCSRTEGVWDYYHVGVLGYGTQIGSAFGGSLAGRDLGERADIRQGKPITLPNSHSEPEPDIAVVQPLGREYLQHHPYPENIFWVIEFASTSLSKDVEDKRKTYASAMIQEYWVVNLQAPQLIIFRHPVHGDYQTHTAVTTGTLSPLPFPAIELSVQRLLEGA
jgi:hypothetical protein